MNKNELFNKTDTVVSETQVALQTLFDELNKGQQKKVLKNEEIKTLFDRYSVNYEGVI